jgi:hypothetical protein
VLALNAFDQLLTRDGGAASVDIDFALGFKASDD